MESIYIQWREVGLQCVENLKASTMNQAVQDLDLGSSCDCHVAAASCGMRGEADSYRTRSTHLLSLLNEGKDFRL